MFHEKSEEKTKLLSECWCLEPESLSSLIVLVTIYTKITKAVIKLSTKTTIYIVYEGSLFQIKYSKPEVPFNNHKETFK